MKTNLFYSSIRSLIGLHYLKQCFPGPLLVAYVVMVSVIFVPNKSHLFAAPLGQVTSVEAFTSTGVVPGCTESMKLISFTGYITVDGPCEVVYRWSRSDGGVSKYDTLSFKEAGTQKVSTSWSLWKSSYEGWELIEVDKPNAIKSNRASFSIYCCKQGEVDCKTHPYAINSCALDLLNTFKKLVRGEDTRVCNTTVGSINVSSAMNTSCYNTGTGPAGVASYTTFYIPSDTIFRVIWGSALHDSLAYHYYGACVPRPLIFPEGLGENHVYGAFLVPVADYQSSPVRLSLYPSAAEYAAVRKKAIKPSDIDDLVGWYFESSSGYFATNTPLAYNSIWSSRGLVVKVRLAGGMEVPCYLFNNYDMAGTMKWKDAGMCAGDGGIVTELKTEKKGLERESPLLQNVPNPFSGETEVRLNVPSNTRQASLIVYDLLGVKRKNLSLTERGNTAVRLSGDELGTGSYVYTLVLDGEVADSKIMVVVK